MAKQSVAVLLVLVLGFDASKGAESFDAVIGRVFTFLIVAWDNDCIHIKDLKNSIRIVCAAQLDA